MNPNGFYGDSKLQAERGLLTLNENDRKLSVNLSENAFSEPNTNCTNNDNRMKICILRPPMIYGPNAKGNFPRLAKLATKVPVFPAWHNKRSMLYIDNLAELIPFGAFPPSHLGNAQASLALLSVWRRFVLQPINKMFVTYYYDPEISKYDFEYQLVSFEESLKRVAESLGKLRA